MGVEMMNGTIRQATWPEQAPAIMPTAGNSTESMSMRAESSCGRGGEDREPGGRGRGRLAHA